MNNDIAGTVNISVNITGWRVVMEVNSDVPGGAETEMVMTAEQAECIANQLFTAVAMVRSGGEKK